ncbi:MAG: hypothetical protein JWP12_2474 [Bacteroidetes bacterium]|nr:hypothetical protein [Bacteroidota bacterium]
MSKLHAEKLIKKDEPGVTIPKGSFRLRFMKEDVLFKKHFKAILLETPSVSVPIDTLSAAEGNFVVDKVEKGHIEGTFNQDSKLTPKANVTKTIEYEAIPVGKEIQPPLQSSLFKDVKEFQSVNNGTLVIGEGSTGLYVIKIQQALNQYFQDKPAYKLLKEEKDFGPLTKNAVSVFQKLNKLKEGTNGVVGQETIQKLDAELYKKETVKINAPVAKTEIPEKKSTKDYSKAGNLPVDDYFYGQRVKNPHGLSREIPENAVPMFNDKGQVEAYFVDNKLVQGIFVYSDKSETWVREDGKTDFDLHEDAVMRKIEPFSWGAHKAASDIGKNVIELVKDPKGYIGSLWEAIKGLKDLDIDKTWERIKNMDETDVSYVMTTLLLMKLSGGGKAGSSVLGAGLSLSKEGIKYFEEIYRFLSKGKGKALLIIESITNTQLYEVLRQIGSTKLGTALKAVGELKPGIGFAAHHIIPLELLKDTFVGDFLRKAYDALWEINGPNNGIWVKEFRKATETAAEQGQHAFHPQYTAQIKQRIQDFIGKMTAKGIEIDGKMAKEFLEEEAARIKKIIEEQSVKKGTKINDLSL